MQHQKIKIDLRSYIVPTIPQAIIYLSLVVLIWFSDNYTNVNFVETSSFSDSSKLAAFLYTIPWLTKAIIFIFTALNAFLISLLNNRYSIIRTRSFLPVLFFTLLMACWHNTHINVISHLTFTLVLLALYVFFGIYRNRNASEQAFSGSLLIAIASIFYSPIILFIPTLWVGLVFFHSLSFRNLLATILGVLTPWIIYSSIYYYLNNNFDWLFDFANNFYLGINIIDQPLNEIIYVGLLFIIATIGLVGVSANINQDSMQTRALINFNILFFVVSFLFSMFFSQMYAIFLPMVAMGYAVILSHPLTINKTDFYKIIFLIFIFVNIAYVISNLMLFPS